MEGGQKMKQIIYAMQFKGSAAPKPDVSGVIEASTTAPSSTISSVMGSDGLTGTVMPIAGENASFKSEVTLTGETSFNEAGTISFGESGHSLRFSTIGQGFIGKSPECNASARLRDVAGGGRRRSVRGCQRNHHVEL